MATPEPALHYLYFPSEAKGRAAARDVAGLGWQAEFRLGADGVNWLVLVSHEWPIPPSAFQTIERSLRELARLHSGDYDGWEAPA